LKDLSGKDSPDSSIEYHSPEMDSDAIAALEGGGRYSQN